MASVGREVSVTTVGGKGTSLSSSSVFAVASGLALVQIDSSAPLVTRLFNQKEPPAPTAISGIRIDSSTSQPPPPSNFKFSDLSRQEARASLLLYLNKLLLSGSATSGDFRPDLPFLIRDALNNNDNDNLFLDFDDRDVTEEELLLSGKSLIVVDGICGILDHQLSALSAVIDTFAALSCEASGAQVSAFDSIVNSGGGDCFSVHKDTIGVASDLKILLNGSKLVGKLKSDAVSGIPQVHGNFREIARLVHSRTRVELNSPVFTGAEGVLTTKALVTPFSALPKALWDLGENSWTRAKLNIDAMTSDVDLRSMLSEMFDRECPRFDCSGMGELFMSYSQAACTGQYIKLFHKLNSFSELVRKIVSWEAITALLSLEGRELVKKLRGNDASSEVETKGESSKPNKKSEKGKKVLGKGTAALVQFIKDRLQSEVGEETVDPSGAVLEKWLQGLLSFLDPKHSGFGTLLEKVKEIVESNESRRLPKLPKGTHDFAKGEMATREKVFSIITDVFKRHGAMALDTPAFELREILMGKYGEDSKLIYDLADQGGELCSLRYDLTVPFARYVAMKHMPSFKRYQIGKVYRRDNPSMARSREFYQCDFDIAGQYETMGPDFEVIKVMTELLDELNIGDYEVKLNHRKLLDGMLEICGVPREKFRTICSSVDKLDKQTFEQIRREMVEEKGLTAETADRIGTYVNKRGAPWELLSKLKQEGSKFLVNEESSKALNELEILFKALEKSKCIDKVVFDLSLARGLDYYTGVIFEAVFNEDKQVGSIAAGGRYDNLIQMFGGNKVPAVGVSLGIERVFHIMKEKDKNQAIRDSETQVLVAILVDDLSLAAELVSELWASKLKAEFSVSKRRSKHFENAKRSRIPLMVMVGEHELNEGIVKLKDVEAAKEEDIPRDRIVEELKRRLGSI